MNVAIFDSANRNGIGSSSGFSIVSSNIWLQDATFTFTSSLHIEPCVHVLVNFAQLHYKPCKNGS